MNPLYSFLGRKDVTVNTIELNYQDGHKEVIDITKQGPKDKEIAK